MSKDMDNEVMLAKRQVRDLAIGAAAMAVGYGIAEYAYLSERADIEWGHVGNLLYILPSNWGVFLIPIILAGMVAYHSLETVIHGSACERHRLFKVLCVSVLVGTAFASVGRLALYNRDFQDWLPAKYSFHQQGFELLIMESNRTRELCVDSVLAKHPRYRQEEYLLRCYEPSEYGREMIKENVFSKIQSTRVSAIYRYSELAFIVLSAFIGFCSFLLMQRMKLIREG